MSGIAILRKLLMKQAMKESAPFQHEGIMSISKTLSGNVDAKVKRWVESAKRQGQDIDKMGEQEIKYILELNKPKAPKVYSNEEAYKILNKFANRNKKGEVIKADFGKPFAEEVVTVDSIVNNITRMEPIAAMKEVNKVLRREGKYKNLSKADQNKIMEDTNDWINQRDPADLWDHKKNRPFRDDPDYDPDMDPEDFARGGPAGVNYLLAEDTNERMPFGAGGFNKARRMFLQAMGAGAAGVGAAKSGLFGLLKGGAKKQVIKDLTTVPIGNPANMPVWFKPLVNKVIKKGEDVTEKFATQEREIVHQVNLEGKIGKDALGVEDVRVTQNLDEGTIRVEYNSPDTIGESGVSLVYKKVKKYLLNAILTLHFNLVKANL